MTKIAVMFRSDIVLKKQYSSVATRQQIWREVVLMCSLARIHVRSNNTFLVLLTVCLWPPKVYLSPGPPPLNATGALLPETQSLWNRGLISRGYE